MLDAVVENPKCTGFFAEVLNVIANMQVEESTALITEDDIDLLVRMQIVQHCLF
eukprot:SAG31_NODE_256_length_19032_cov_5.305181_11_plen_54_part_00